jgi:predicted transcriptional regulator
MNGITKAIKEVGGQAKFAKLLGITQQAASSWKRLGYAPWRRIVEIEQYTGVPKEELINKNLFELIKPVTSYFENVKKTFDSCLLCGFSKNKDIYIVEVVIEDKAEFVTNCDCCNFIKQLKEKDSQ